MTSDAIFCGVIELVQRINQNRDLDKRVFPDREKEYGSKEFVRAFSSTVFLMSQVMYVANQEMSDFGSMSYRNSLLWRSLEPVYEHFSKSIDDHGIDHLYSSPFNILRDHISEIFSHSILPAHACERVSFILLSYGVQTLIDPFAGNGFVPFRFELMGFRVFASDIVSGKSQPIEWTNVETLDAKDLEFSSIAHNLEGESCLILSWVHPETPGMKDLLHRFSGEFILLIGDKTSCGTDEMYDVLLDMSQWRVFSRIEVPQFPCHRDYITIYHKVGSTARVVCINSLFLFAFFQLDMFILVDTKGTNSFAKLEFITKIEATRQKQIIYSSVGLK